MIITIIANITKHNIDNSNEKQIYKDAEKYYNESSDDGEYDYCSGKQPAHNRFSNTLQVLLDILTASAYRLPKLISEIVEFPSSLQPNSYNSYAICPRCKNPIERDYQKYCDSCGQRLDWSNYDDGEYEHFDEEE